MATPEQSKAGKLTVALDAHGCDFGPAALAQGALARMVSLLACRSLKRALARFEPSKHNGAPLLRLKGVVVKSHGNAGHAAMANAIVEAVKESERHVPRRIEAMINDYSIEESL